ncbi:nucleotidyltransferase family protein [Arenicella xantha]|uniref:Molybdenum cofactor cytidylyltransferase n=1 Tax=Arenicella xantha TaxID=644221 RepID=A0A395JKI0_9GAMM|nr:nucleotidyltransferase family protein [Arenicella xantha]RBP49382.1 molybdenum cofactor cytidylyltransferase [Arenicella xantha]
MADTKTDCIVLAAGHSRRFGAAKLMHTMPDGRALIEHTIAIYQAVFDVVHVVARDDDLELQALLNRVGAMPIINTRAEQGMSQSIVAGIRSSDAQCGILIALGDMPYVDVDTVRKIAAELHADNIVMPRCQGRIGNPVAFGVAYFDELLRLNGDAGARALINQNLANVTSVEVSDKGIFKDIDTPQDLLSRT